MEYFISYEGYFVGNEGTIKNKKGKIIARSPNQCGYYQLRIKGKDNYVHRIVAQLFVDNNDPLATQVDHINGIRTDNRAVNLRWVRPEDNSKNRHSKEYFKELGIKYENKWQKSEKYKEYLRKKHFFKKVLS